METGQERFLACFIFQRQSLSRNKLGAAMLPPHEGGIKGLLAGAGVAGAAFAPGKPRIVTATCRGLLLFFTRFLEQRFAREANLVPFDREHLHQNLVAELQFVANVANPML